MTDSNGVVQWSADYKPFGEATIAVNTITSNLRNPGEYFDAETGLHYNYFRDRNPVLGRYIEKDPLGIMRGTNHLYAALTNNPISSTDPFGLCNVSVLFSQLGPTWYHAYIVTTDPDGTQVYFRGGPSGAGPSSGASGAISSGTGGSSSGRSGSGSYCSNSSNSSSPGASPGGLGQNNGAWGPISTIYGPYVPGTPDWSSSPQPSMTVLNNNSSCAAYNAAFAQSMVNIQNANIPYNPFSTNSNAVVHTTLSNAGLNPGTPPVWVPGWGTTLSLPSNFNIGNSRGWGYAGIPPL